MKLIVNPHKIEIEKTPVNEKEINITECEFEFSEEISNEFVKEAYFTLNGESYKQVIVNNECDIPHEVLEEKGTVEIGVVAFIIEDETIVKRYNPSPVYISTLDGSLKDAENSQPITPSEFEQYEQALQDGLTEIDERLEDITTAINEANNLNLEVSKVDTTTTVTITKKDGTQESVNIEDGADFEYNWDGTSLGVKTSEEQEYQYVNLKGDTGEAGHTPTRGEDYWTEQDQQQVVSEATADVMSQISIPTKTSDLINNSGFIDNSVNNLTNYYAKTDLYNKTEIDSKISSVYKYKGSVATYSDLPDSDLTVGDVYNVETDGSNYAWNGTAWDKLGGDVDLSNYYNKTQTDTLLNGKVDTSTLNDYYTKTRADELLATKVGFTDYPNGNNAGVIKATNDYAIQVTQNGNLQAQTKGYSDYLNAYNSMFIGKGTLENVIKDKGLVSNTDYANDNTGGVIKTGGFGGSARQSSTGILYAIIKTYNEYVSTSSNVFISKGTLENVITGKNLETANNKVTSLSSSSTDTQYPSAKCVYDSQASQDALIGAKVNKSSFVYDSNTETLSITIS